jgi:hypothetical protein
LEPIFLPIAAFSLMTEKQSPSDAPIAFGAGNERQYYVSGGHDKMTS